MVVLNVKIPLGKGCFALVDTEDIRKMLLQPDNSQIYIDGIKRGKGMKRFAQSKKRQLQKENEVF